MTAAAILAAALLVAAPGCARRPKPLPAVTVSGTVTLDGVPLESGTVTFIPDLPEEAGGRPGIARIESGGRYTLGNANPEKPRGTVAGPCAVTVLWMEPALDECGRPTARLCSPRAYADMRTTPLHVTVRDGVQTIDLALRSHPSGQGDAEVSSGRRRADQRR